MTLPISFLHFPLFLFRYILLLFLIKKYCYTALSYIGFFMNHSLWLYHVLRINPKLDKDVYFVRKLLVCERYVGYTLCSRADLAQWQSTLHVVRGCRFKSCSPHPFTRYPLIVGKTFLVTAFCWDQDSHIPYPRSKWYYETNRAHSEIESVIMGLKKTQKRQMGFTYEKNQVSTVMWRGNWYGTSQQAEILQLKR